MTSSLIVGPVPYEESCAQLGHTPDFERIARLECTLHRAALVAMFGPPPEGVTIAVRSNPHDFGTYYDLAVRVDDGDPDARAYALRLEDEGPGRWHDAGFTAPVDYGERGAVIHVTHGDLASGIRAAVLTLGQFPDREAQAAMRANLVAAYPEHAGAPAASS
ncbi:hypothetical protein PX554_20080 [Sphingomonas sp. H39-1-10]|uniref:hypothetical protein n=1 Tax=Sphingomonas pollutisoli TaxID=3030829 RepID=UPI0023B96601|nr:hypothetical protein [Sphingomonas pollutisoli]MDF0490432.1 hypothetical protein [Sphingomonas pollutisoli]